MKEIYNGETVALGGPNLVTKELVVDEATGEKAKFTYDKTTGAIAVQDEVDENSINPVTGRAVAKAIEQGGGGGGGGESNVTTFEGGFKVAKNGAGSDVTVNLVNPGSSIVLGTAKFTDFDAWDGGGGATLLTACFSFGSEWGHVVDGGTANLHIGDELDGLEIQNFAGLFYSSTPGGSQPAGPNLTPSPSWPTGTFSGGDFTVTSPYPESVVTNAVCLKLFVVFSGITPEALEARLANANWYVSNWPTTQTAASIDVTQLPSITGQAGKALKVNSGATGLEWGEAGGSSYTAGNGINIDNNSKISVDYDTQTLRMGRDQALTAQSNYAFQNIFSTYGLNQIKTNRSITMPTFSGNVHLVAGSADGYAVCKKSVAFTNGTYPGSQFTMDIPETGAANWDVTGNIYAWNSLPVFITIVGTSGDTNSPNGETAIAIRDTSDTSDIYFTGVVNATKLAVKNPIPAATAADAGKVLQVQNNGTLAWVTLS